MLLISLTIDNFYKRRAFQLNAKENLKEWLEEATEEEENYHEI
jgi:hypothetical protein